MRRDSLAKTSHARSSPRRGAAWPAVVALAAALTALPAHGSPHRLFLDHDLDGDLSSIDSTVVRAGVVTLILEVGDGPALDGRSYDLSIRMMTCGGDPTDFYDECDLATGAAWSDSAGGDDGWCNPAIHSECEFLLGVGMGCETPWPRARLQTQLHWRAGDRVVLGRFFAGYPNCGLETSPLWIVARFEDLPGQLVSGTILVLQPNPVDDSSWGRIKARYRR